MQRIFDIYLKLFLLGTMVFYVPNQMMYAPQEKFFQFGAIGFLALSLIVPARRVINNAFLGVLFAYSLLITLIAHFGASSVGKLENIMFGIIVIKTIAERVDLNFKGIGNFFLCFYILNIFQLSLQVLDIDPIFTNVFQQNMAQIDQTGFLSSRFILASVGALTLPFAYTASPLSLLAVVPLLWFGKSSSCVLASTLVLVIILSKGHLKRVLLSLAVLLGLVLSYVLLVDMPTGSFFTNRFPVWSAGISYLKGQPWFGLGLGSWLKTAFITVGANGAQEQWTWAHNDFLQWGFEVGVFGVILMWAWVKNLFKTCGDRILIGAFSTLCIIAFFHFPFHIARLAGLGCFIIACLEAKRSELCQKSNP